MSDLSPFISVVIPHLNQAEQLRNCLSSLKAQTLRADRFEIIVVDNGSKALPEAICGSFERVELLREPTPGPGPARNRGVQAARAPILAFIDADCLADRDWLATIAANFEEDGACQIIGGDVRIAYNDARRITMLEAYESIFAYRQQEYIERQGFSGTGNLAVRRSSYDAVGTFAGKDIAEDREWGRRATGAGFTIRYVPEMLVFHPARTSFAELRAKWDRHVSHDFEECAQGGLGRLRWFVLAVAVLGSPIFEIRRIACTPRVSRWRERLLAAIVLIRIRIYRARTMFHLFIWGRRASTAQAWNVR